MNEQIEKLAKELSRIGMTVGTGWEDVAKYVLERELTAQLNTLVDYGEPYCGSLSVRAKKRYDELENQLQQLRASK